MNSIMISDESRKDTATQFFGVPTYKITINNDVTAHSIPNTDRQQPDKFLCSVIVVSLLACVADLCHHAHVTVVYIE